MDMYHWNKQFQALSGYETIPTSKGAPLLTRLGRRYPSFKHLVRVDYVLNSGLDRAVVEVLGGGYCSQNLLLTTI